MKNENKCKYNCKESYGERVSKWCDICQIEYFDNLQDYADDLRKDSNNSTRNSLSKS